MKIKRTRDFQEIYFGSKANRTCWWIDIGGGVRKRTRHSTGFLAGWVMCAINDADNPGELYLTFGIPAFSPLSMDGEHSALKVLSLLEAYCAKYLLSWPLSQYRHMPCDGLNNVCVSDLYLVIWRNYAVSILESMFKASAVISSYGMQLL